MSSTSRTCTVEGCDRPRDRPRYCFTHYQQARRTGSPVPSRRRQDGCDVDGCDGPHMARGYCDPHYRRLLRYGSPEDMPPDRRLPIDEVIRLRRLVGLPDDGPSDLDRHRWQLQEARS